MKKLFLTAIALLLCMGLSLTVFAASDRLYDEADVLTAQEESTILEQLNSVAEAYQVEVVIAIVEDLDGYSADRYVQAFYDENGYGIGQNRDGVLLLVAMEEREYRILSNGFGAQAITDGEIDSISDDIAPYLSDGDYAKAFESFIEACRYQIDGEINGFPFDYVTSLLISLGIGLVIALIATGSMKGKLKTVRMQKTANQYTRQGSMQITHSSDFFLYRTVNRTKRESSSSGSSGSSRNVGGGKF